MSEISEVTSDGTEIPATSETTTQTDESALGDAGKKALQALRAEVKELKAQLKATESADAGTGDPAGDSDTPSVSTRDAATDVTPKKPRFQGTGDGGARRTAPDAKPQLSRADLSGMTPKQIDAARRNGQLRNLLSGKA